MQHVYTFRFDLLDQQNEVVGTLDVDRDSAPTIENDVNSAIKRRLTGLRLDPDQADEIDPLSNRVRPVLVNADGEFPLGVFLFAKSPRERWTYGRPMTADLVDQLIGLDQPEQRPWSFPPNTSIESALNTLVFQGHVIASDIESTTATTGASPLAWDVGTHLLAIMNDVAALAGFYSPYYDNSGVLILRSVPDLATTTPVASYGPDPGQTSIMNGTIVESDDLLDAPNQYIVVDTGATEEPIYGFYNIPSSAPHSLANRGVVISRRYDRQGLLSRTHANQVAKSIAQQDRDTFEWVEFDAEPNPLHDTFDVVDYLGNRYREQSWRLPLVAGGMQHHELRRVYPEDLVP